MRAFVRHNALSISVAIASLTAIAWMGLVGDTWSDYEVEAEPAFQAIAHGHLSQFLRLLPVYAGSFIERAPAAILAGAAGGGQLAVYRAVAIPCLLAAGIFGVWLVADLRRRHASRLTRATTLMVCVANPIALLAVEVGHPEELLGACLCAAALLAAPSARTPGRALAAGAVLGLAIANKEVAVVLAGPLLLAIAPGVRRFGLIAMGAIAAALLLPALLVSGSSVGSTLHATASTDSTIFQPFQVWWFLGHHGPLVHGLFGEAKPGFRTAPGWVGPISHPLILAVSAIVPATLWPSARRHQLGLERMLLAACLLTLARCLLDTWDITYYILPFLFCLLAWETRRPERPPWLSLSATVLAWISFDWMRVHESADVQAVFFVAWTVPLELWLAARLWDLPLSTLSRRPRGGELSRRPSAAFPAS